MRYLIVVSIFLLSVFIYLKNTEKFVPSEDIVVPTQSSGRKRHGSKFYPTAPNATPVAEVVIPSDFYQGNQMPTDLEGPYWPSTVLPRNVPDYAYRQSRNWTT